MKLTLRQLRFISGEVDKLKKEFADLKADMNKSPVSKYIGCNAIQSKLDFLDILLSLDKEADNG